jgi:uncharacterized linocin/CFP29 family protein
MFDLVSNTNEGIVAEGTVASRLLENDFNIHCLRPFIGNDGRNYISVMNAKGELEAKPVNNVTTTLRKDDWIQLDDAIVKAAKPRLKAVADLRGAGLTYSIPNGMAKTVLQTETQSDIDPAIVSMDGLREGANDRPVFELTNLPLPIIHKDFSYSARQLAASRNGGSPLDTTHAELAARRVAEEAEKMLLGVSTVADQYAYASGTIYGYTDFPSRLTRTITAPTASGWTGTTFLQDVMAMVQQSKNAFHYGPFMLYVASAWDQYLDDDFKAASDKTIRNRVKELNDIQDIRTLDYLTGFDVILVQMTTDVIREVIGMDVTTVQWESKGGMQLNFKVMAILVPQLRADQNSNTGIVHGTTA